MIFTYILDIFYYFILEFILILVINGLALTDVTIIKVSPW